MVSTKFDSKSYKPWKPVARPVSKSDLARPVATNGPPAVPPKPGGKVFVYVYEAPGRPGTYQTITQSGSGSLPPNAQLVIGGLPPAPSNGPTNLQGARYPQTDECLDPNNPVVKLKRQAKKAGRGYKVLADVNRVRSSSRGGRMFMKQKERMENYTSLESSGKMKPDADERSKNKAGSEERSTPWNMAKTSAAAVKYIPASLYSNISRERKKKGQVLPPLHSPPPEWRAKVETDYRLYEAEQTLPTRRWNTVDAMHRSHSARSESAPPPESAFPNDYYPEENDRYYVGSVNGMRPESRGATPVVAVNFDAKMHKGAPHRKQGVRTGRGTFTTTPHVQLDFNARPVGWSRAYAENY